METTTSAALSQNGPLANRQEPDNTILAGHSANFIVPDELDEYNPAAGMDFTARPKVEDVPTSVHEMAISDAAWQETLARQKEQDEYDWGDVAKDSFSTSLPGALARIAGDAIYGTPDDGPNLTPLSEQSFDERLKLAQQMGLAESAIWELQDARTEEEFDFLINRANEFQQARDRLMSNGWGAFAVDFLIQNFNPAELALGYGVVSPLRRLMKGADYSRKALAAGTGLAGATALTTSMAIQDYSGGAPSLGEYIFAAGLGASLGAALGPLGYSPMSAAERKAMADAATRYVKLGEEVMQREVAAMAAADAPSSTASVKAAEAATTKVAEAPAPAPVKPTADTAAEVVASLQRRLEDIDEELTYAERNNDDGTLASTIDELRQEAIDIEARIGMLSEEPAPVVPQTKMVDPPEMEATPQMLKSKSFVGAYEGPEPGSYYRIDATQKGDDGFFDMSGPFRVVKIDASGNVTRLADEAATMADAKAIIPKREVAEEVAAPLPTEGGDTALAARIFDQIDALREFDPELADTLAELRDQLIPSTADDLTPAPQSAGAAATPETSLPPDLDFIRNQAVRWIKNEDVAYSRFANVRPDRAAFTLKSDNPLSRLLTRHVMDDVVGRTDHGTNPFSADLDGEQILGKLTAPYLQARKNLWHEYAKAMAIPRHTWHFKAGEFYNRAGEFMSGKPLPDDMPQAAKNAIKKLADVQAEQFELARKLAQNPLYRPGVPDEMQRIARPLPNAVNLKPPSAGTYYFPRKYSSKKVALEVSRRDGKFLSRIFTDAIRKAQPGLQDHYVKALGAGMAKNIRNRAFGLGDDWTIAFADGDRARFIELLGRDTGLSPGEIEEIAMKMFDGKAPDPGDVMGNFKHRVMLDENHVDDATGVAIMDLMDKNADDAFLAYMTRLSGRLALSRMVVKAPQVPRFRSIRKPDGTEELIPDGFHGGETLLDGVRTDADLQGYFRSMAEWAAQHGDELLRSQTQVDINRLQFAVDRILKRPLDTQGTKFAQIMRNIRDYQFTRLMWSVPISMMNEFVLPVATLGVKAGFKHMPSMRRVIDDAGRQRLKSPLFDEIEHMGIGYEHLHNVTFRSADNFADDQAALINGSFHEKLTDWLHYGTKLTGHYSGMTNVQAFSERLAASAAFQKIANMAADYKPGHAFIGDDLKRWRQLGLSDEMMVRVFDNFKHVDHVDSIYFPGSGKKITRLNFHKWDDPEAAEAVEQAVFRLSRKLIQKQSVGNTAIWMSDPLHQSLWQFRNFSFTALPNHTLYNLHMRDAAAVRTLVWSTTWAATVRAMQVKLIAAQRPDGAEYEAKHGTPWALAKAGFSRSGYASVSPMFIDSLLRMLGQPGAFEARSTGQASDVFGGIPFVSSYNSIVEGMGGVFGSLIDDRQISQAELRALGSLIPGFTQPMTGILSQLVADRPKRAPRKKADW
jgi:hypothetical protein